ncbi:alpha/beta hydrolase [Sediminibacterium sp.]|uniref:alpha/beta hydrolase n=1 Tax=Sediminibacterium sp. TaxID=1917865 RepID=UPI003F695795
MKSIVLFICFVICSSSAFSQSFSGDWAGTLSANKRNVEIMLHVSKSDAFYEVGLDVPMQKAYNVKASEVFVRGDSIFISIKSISLKFIGVLQNNSLINGTWMQAGITIQVPLYRKGDVSIPKTFNRPQTPKPPFSYKSEDIEFDNIDKSIHFGATLTLPLEGNKLSSNSSDKFPVIILITGSGKQDRDETMFDHKPFAVIADYFTMKGMAVLRIDDREIGKSSGDFIKSTTFDFVNDIDAAIDYLKTRTEININNISLLGHSEGGLIASIVASKRSDIKNIILMAAPGLTPSELFEKQTASLLASKDVAKNSILSMTPMLRELVNNIINATDTAGVFNDCVDIFKQWQVKQSYATVKSTTGVTDEESMMLYIRRLIQNLWLPWNKNFFKIAPSDYISKLSCNVLAINGEKDIQVEANSNLKAIENNLKISKSKDFEIKIFSGLNHLFQKCNKCTIEEYSDIEETIAPEVLEIMSNWLLSRIKS